MNANLPLIKYFCEYKSSYYFVELKNGNHWYCFIEYPFGNENKQEFGKLSIDDLLFINTTELTQNIPLDLSAPPFQLGVFFSEIKNMKALRHIYTEVLDELGVKYNNVREYFQWDKELGRLLPTLMLNARNYQEGIEYAKNYCREYIIKKLNLKTKEE